MSKKEIKKEEIEETTKKAQKDFFMDNMPYLIIIFFLIIIRTFIATPVKVQGSSMYPTLQSKDAMILYKLSKHTRGIKRFDIVVVTTDSGKIIKRVIGMPGEKIRYKIEKDEDGNEKGVLYINGKVMKEDFIDDVAKVRTCHENWDLCNEEIEIGENEYFVMGDNRINSTDSRMIGPVTFDAIDGNTKVIIWPPSRMGNVK